MFSKFNDGEIHSKRKLKIQWNIRWDDFHSASMVLSWHSENLVWRQAQLVDGKISCKLCDFVDVFQQINPSKGPATTSEDSSPVARRQQKVENPPRSETWPKLLFQKLVPETFFSSFWMYFRKWNEIPGVFLDVHSFLRLKELKRMSDRGNSLVAGRFVSVNKVPSKWN